MVWYGIVNGSSYNANEGNIEHPSTCVKTISEKIFLGNLGTRDLQDRGQSLESILLRQLMRKFGKRLRKQSGAKTDE